jgi:7-cyano-7-deazaguanine synthase
MALVLLASGGIDSAVIAAQAAKDGIETWPVYVHYGQRAAEREWDACRQVMKQIGVKPPTMVDLAGYGAAIRSGLTDPSMDIYADAFLPGRNMLFLLVGAAHAQRKGISTVAIGLLRDDTALFADQKREFVQRAEQALRLAVDWEIEVATPLAKLTKSDVLTAARRFKISGTYSCHSGEPTPCGQCISCKELKAAKEA